MGDPSLGSAYFIQCDAGKCEKKEEKKTQTYSAMHLLEIFLKKPRFSTLNLRRGMWTTNIHLSVSASNNPFVPIIQ